MRNGIRRRDGGRVALGSAGVGLLAVIDNGPGVPKADLPRITKRFARVESSRNTPGHGLGLSLVSAVAKLHGGQLIMSNDQPGFSATVELPRTRSREQARHRSRGGARNIDENSRATASEMTVCRADGGIMTENQKEALTKVPAVTLGFWIIKVLATTLGETGGDTVTMTWLGETTDHPVPNGYLIGTTIFGILLIGLSSRRSGRASSTRGSTGQPSSPRRPAERRWRTSPIDRLASDIPAGRSCCWLASFVAIRLVQDIRHG